jgi:hypothetical protein
MASAAVIGACAWANCERAKTPEGLKAVFKDFNYSGEALAKQLQTFRQHGVIGIESIKRIQEPHSLPKPYTLWVLLAAVDIKILLSRYVTGVDSVMLTASVVLFCSSMPTIAEGH